MKLNELQLSSELSSDDSLEEILPRYGWSVLGTGYHATVAEHPQKKYVLKIFTRTNRYRYFVNFVHDHQSNPHLPKFGSVVKNIPNNDEYAYVRMEKLTPASQPLCDSHLSEMVSIVAAFEQRRFRISDTMLAAIETKLQPIDFSLSDMMTKTKLNQIYKKIGPPPAAWQTMVNDLVAFTVALPKQPKMDLWQDNFMMRGNTLVLTDPYA